MTDEKQKPEDEVTEEELENVAGGVKEVPIEKTTGDESGTIKGTVSRDTTKTSGASPPVVVVEPDGTVKVPQK